MVLIFCLLQKHVNLKESAQNGNKLIVHTLTQNENLGLAHSLVYAPADWVEKKQQDTYDDF